MRQGQGCTRILSDTFPQLDGVFTPKLLFPAENWRATASAWPSISCTQKTDHFAIHFWPWETLETLLKCGTRSCFACTFQIWGRKQRNMSINFPLITSHLVQFKELQMSNSSCPIYAKRIIIKIPS
jgi:hypothetical protein